MATGMQAAVLYGKEDVRIEDVERPLPGVGEIVVRVHAALTCGTDLKTYRRGYHAKMLNMPALFGHELAGVVAAAGEGVSAFCPGTRVVALNSAPCDRCYWCQRGQQNLCEDLLFNNGAYAEWIRVPARIVEKNTLAIPAHVTDEHAALTEPLACVLRGLEESRAQRGDTMAVIGAGPIGLLMIHAAALAGVHVIAVVKHDQQVSAALRLGAQHVVQTTKVKDSIAAVRALTPDHRGVDIAIEAVALPLTWQWAVDMVRRGGLVNFFGGPAKGTRVDLDTNHLHYNDIELKASFHHTPAVCRRALALIANPSFDADAFITGHAPLRDLVSVFQGMMRRTNEIKTVILP
jgi:L-iditol 2-dehydrogenase